LARAAFALDDLKLAKPAFRPDPTSRKPCAPAGSIAGIRHAIGGAVGGLDFLPLVLGALRPRAAAARLFHAGAAGAVRLHAPAVLRDRAAELGGYDVSDAGAVRLVN
jgi:hypothetical protein